MTIHEIYKKEKLSSRTYWVCNYNNLITIKELKEYLEEHKSFEKLSYCGKKSNKELIKICHNEQKEIFENLEVKTKEEEKEEERLKKTIFNLTEVQKEVVYNFILINTKSLSIRTENALLAYLENNLNIENFTKKILFMERFRLHKIKNIGAKSFLELENYISLIKIFILEVSQSKEEKTLISLKNNFLIKRAFSISNTPSEILESQSIFSLAHFLLEKKAFFNENETFVVKKTLKLYHQQENITLDTVGKLIGLTRERVRQIRKKCLEEFFSKLLFIQIFEDNLYEKYGLETDGKQIEIEDTTVFKINQQNKTNLSRQFIGCIVFAYLCNKYTFIGNLEDVLQYKYFNSSRRYNWKDFYLVETKIATEVNFIALINDIDNRLKSKITKTYTLLFKDYLSNFLTYNNISFLEDAFSISENIVNKEFGLFLNAEKKITFKRNTYKQAYKYAFEALEKLGKPSKVEEIYRKVTELFPNYKTEEAKIRVAMKRKDGFVPIGRKSVFGLKKWEQEIEGFKGGTIRSIATEYLSNFSAPKHISDLTEYVLKFRPKSNQYSILQNLKLDKSNTYVFFRNSYVGLFSKKYDPKYTEIIFKYANIRSWEESLEFLQQFVLKENKLPYSRTIHPEELKIYRWLNVQKCRIKQGKLDADKTSKINRIINQFSNNGKREISRNSKSFQNQLSLFEK